jgi:hypothetical protein
MSSATALCGPITPIGENHFDMVKPKDRRSDSYLALKEAFDLTKPPSLSKEDRSKASSKPNSSAPTTRKKGNLSDRTADPALSTPVVRLAGFVIDPLIVGTTLQLRVLLANDRDKTVSTKGYFCAGLIDTLPDANDGKTRLNLENQIWSCAMKRSLDESALPNPAPPKSQVSVPDLLTNFVITDQMLAKIDGDGGVYVAGVVIDADRKYAPVSYCVLIDKNRMGPAPNLCHSHN